MRLLRLIRTSVFAAFPVLLMNACATSSEQPLGGCASCSSTEFCCAGSCLAFGETCDPLADAGTDDAQAFDAESDDASQVRDAATGDLGTTTSDAAANDATPPWIDPEIECRMGTPSRPIRGVCEDATSYHECGDPSSHVGCDTGICLEWMHEGTQYASCAPLGAIGTCDPTEARNVCEGNQTHNCWGASSTWEPGTYPDRVYPGIDVVQDCPSTVSNGVCVLGTISYAIPPGWDTSFAICVDSTETTCDPSTFINSCEGGRCVPDSFGHSAVRVACTEASSTCVETELHEAGLVCIPSTWTPSEHPATAEPVNVECVGMDLIRVEQYGYDSFKNCDEHFHASGGGPGLAAHCFQPPDGSAPLCMLDDAIVCDVANSRGPCIDETHTRYCHEWVEASDECTDSVCDEASGECILPPSCWPELPFFESCAGHNHKWIKGECDHNDATLAPCPACTETESGVTCSE